MRFFAPYGGLVRGINVKFDTGPLRCTKLYVDKSIFGGSSPPKKSKIAKFANFVALHRRLPCSILVKFLSFMQTFHMYKCFKFGMFRFINKGVIGKTRDGENSPLNFRAPYCRNYWSDLRKLGVFQKWYGHVLSACKVLYRSATTRRRGDGKVWSFLSVILFVMWDEVHSF